MEQGVHRVARQLKIGAVDAVSGFTNAHWTSPARPTGACSAARVAIMNNGAHKARG